MSTQQHNSPAFLPKLGLEAGFSYTGDSARCGLRRFLRMRPVSGTVIETERREKPTGFGVQVMAQVCDICGKGPQFGNNISHAHNVSRRRWNVNLQKVKALVNGASKRVRVCTSCIKTGKIVKAA
jgi:large subunit ribosomal protein L28